MLVPGRPEPASRREAAGGAGRLRPTRVARVLIGGAGGAEPLLEKQRAKTEKKLVKKRGKKRATFYADSFAFGLIGNLLGLKMETKAPKCELEACTKANAELQDGRRAAEAREGAAESKLRLERQGHEGMSRKPPCFLLNLCQG